MAVVVPNVEVNLVEVSWAPVASFCLLLGLSPWDDPPLRAGTQLGTDTTGWGVLSPVPQWLKGQEVLVWSPQPCELPHHHSLNQTTPAQPSAPAGPADRQGSQTCHSPATPGDSKALGMGSVA